MRNLYRKLALAVPLAVGATIGVAPSAFAGTPTGPWSLSPHGSAAAPHVVAPHTATPHVVAPISTGWVDIVNSKGNVTQETGTVAVASVLYGQGQINNGVSLTLTVGGLYAFGLSVQFPTQAGGIYTQTSGSTVDLVNGFTNSFIGVGPLTGGCQSNLGTAGGTSQIQVDQFVDSGSPPNR